jgi:hypothetical protein
MTAGNGCVLGASMSENADKTSLEEAYGQFKTEARQLNPNYTSNVHNLGFVKALKS